MVASLVCQGLQLVHELFDVLELPIDGCKPDIGNLVELMQLFHDFLSHHSALDLCFAHFLNPLFDSISHGFDGAGADRPFFTGFLEARENLRTVKGLTATVFLHDNWKNFFDTFVGRIATLTPKAFATATNNFAFLGHTRIDHLVFEFIAEGTFHWKRPALSLAAD